MDGIINDLMYTDYVLIFTCCFVFLCGLKKGIELISYFKKKFRIKTGIDTDKESIEDRIATLERHDKWQYSEISKISSGVDDIKKHLSERETRDNEKTVATLRNQLYGLHEKFTNRDSIDTTGLKTFCELGKIYERAGGDDIYHDKLKPEIMKLSIKDENE